MTPKICKFKTPGKVACSIGGVFSATKCGFNPASCETLITRSRPGAIPQYSPDHPIEFTSEVEIDKGLLEIIESFCRGGVLAGYPVTPGHFINISIIAFFNGLFEEDAEPDLFVEAVTQGGMPREEVWEKLKAAVREGEETSTLLQAHLNMAERKGSGG